MSRQLRSCKRWLRKNRNSRSLAELRTGSHQPIGWLGLVVANLMPDWRDFGRNVPIDLKKLQIPCSEALVFMVSSRVRSAIQIFAAFPQKSYPVAVQRTYMAKPGEVEKQWHIVDATDEVLGRLAGDIAVILMGKHRPEYTPHVDCGDFVIVTNVEKIGMTGNKMNDRHYTWYTGYPGLRLESYQDRQARKPEDLLLHAVRRMLPKNKLARHMLSKLKMYSGPDHPHTAQQPVELVRKSKKVTA